ncbi:hypothetical protein SAMN04487972_1289 [Paracoccus halophilus]|uniref:Uncharacterized protein n=1 Tax=Paracoccus halophilus TaxID=376733 RepID=A0A1I0U8C6_9RHOB|nr:hypothetical protein [Paracoccus halophilus]SFA60349.1 hypothetical protein SAMN04487972_1289 [Paracoccus halophilus]
MPNRRKMCFRRNALEQDFLGHPRPRRIADCFHSTAKNYHAESFHALTEGRFVDVDYGCKTALLDSGEQVIVIERKSWLEGFEPAIFRL